ncbi:MAG TPA: thioredoxin domain-containing protein [Thermomicrobiales bacterium]
MVNRLAQETSPYLLQHKDNPVDWYPWGPEALEKARREDKPILVSIGYSACHWCHVMEHESFEDESTAALMNERFVNIKVDREERPDLDAIYMSAVQAMTGQGGWPLNVFLTPDGVPFYGGTYWPPEDRPGLPAFRKVLLAVSDAYRERKEEVLQSAEQIRAFLIAASRARPEASALQPKILDDAIEALWRDFDNRQGGFGGAPKFPQPSALEFALRYHHRTADERAETMVRLTLDKMAAGGMYDHLGGGFHRYAVDAIWLVPHFEKMLYDNAQLARLYLDAYRAFGDERYRQIVTETLDYVAREMTDPEGGFYATQDADSEGEEGRFYVWTSDEIAAVLGSADAALVNRMYGVTKRGNFEGKSILHLAQSPTEVAAEFGLSVEEVQTRVAEAKRKLFAAREQRVRPGRDEKVITSWNGMMLRAFAEASRALDRPDYRDIAVRNATFLLTRLRDGDRLLHTYKDGVAKIGGYLEDYANLAEGLLALYEATFDRRWLDEAVRLVEVMIAEFSDEDGIGFYDTGTSHEALVARPREVQDGATPSGNAIAVSLLLRLATMTERGDWQRRAESLLQSMARPMAEHPLAFGRWLSALERYLGTPREVVIAGKPSDPAVERFAATVYRRYEPQAVIGLADPDDAALTERFPFLANRPPKNGQVAAYVCERYACLPPVTDPEDLAIQLEQGTGVAWQEF